MEFNEENSNIYDLYARISLAGYEVMHELSGCLLQSLLPPEASILAVGAGTGQEIITLSKFGIDWRFTGLDPSEQMLKVASIRLHQEGLKDRVELIPHSIKDFSTNTFFDAATLMLVLHFLKQRQEKLQLLRNIAKRLKLNAPFILASLYGDVSSDRILLSAWKNQWANKGISRKEIEDKFQEFLPLIHPLSEAELVELLHEAGFYQVQRFFSSLSFGAWIAQKVG